MMNNNPSVPDEIKAQASRWVPVILAGSLAGLIAAIPMAGVMVGLNRVLPSRKKSWFERFVALPPKQITGRLAKRSGLGGLVRPGRSWDASTWAMHLGYGAATASVYPVVFRRLPLPRVLRGMLFALTVWGASYLGWLPAANILPPATDQPLRRNAIIIASHLVWGSLIALITGKLIELERDEL